MLGRRLHIFPIVMAFYLPVAFFITYGMAVHYDHVYTVFPYISDTGTVPPESCVFGQLLNIYAALTAWCMYLRYKQVRLYYKHVESQGLVVGSPRCRSVRRKQVANKVCLVIGIITALGVSIVGNFQVDNAVEVHLIGAMMAFGGAGVYCWMQAILSYKMAKLPHSNPCCRHARVALCVVHTICFFVMLITTKLSVDKFPLEFDMIKKWSPSQAGYPEHLVATISEWIMAFVSSAYFLTFTGELKVIRSKVLVLPIHPSENGNNNSIGPDGSAESSGIQSSQSAAPLSFGTSDLNRAYVYNGEE